MVLELRVFKTVMNLENIIFTCMYIEVGRVLFES